jgi:hypothetical protein
MEKLPSVSEKRLLIKANISDVAFSESIISFSNEPHSFCIDHT